MKRLLVQKKLLIICGVCICLVAGLSVLTKQALSHSGNDPSVYTEAPGSDAEDDANNAISDTIDPEDTTNTVERPVSDDGSEALTEEEQRLADDAMKYGVSPISGTFTTYVNLNFREGPSTNYDIISTSPKGSKIPIIGRASNGWYQVKINEVIGYMCDDYLDGQGSLVLNTYDIDNVVKLAMDKAKAAGIGTVEDYLEQRVKAGLMSSDEYTLLAPSGKGDYYCAVFEVSSENAYAYDGTVLTSEDEIAQYLVDRFITDAVEYCYFENNGTFTVGGIPYYEVRCYTKNGKSDFAKEVETLESSNTYDESADDDSEDAELDDRSSEDEDAVDYNNMYTE